MAAILERARSNGFGGPTPDVPIWRFSVKEYHELIHAGILHSGDPIELLEGLLVFKMSKNPPHVTSNALLRDMLIGLVSVGWYVNAQDPITTVESEPEPDISVIRGERLQFLDRHPNPSDVSMIAEVADSSLSHDRGFKKRVYARAGIPVYWIVNLIDRCIEVYTDPTGPCEQPDYRQPQIFGLNDAVPVVLDGQEIGRIAVKDVIP